MTNTELYFLYYSLLSRDAFWFNEIFNVRHERFLSSRSVPVQYVYNDNFQTFKVSSEIFSFLFKDI
jgi:hypothetical protein